jgi:hypothetical protein
MHRETEQREAHELAAGDEAQRGDDHGGGNGNDE